MYVGALDAVSNRSDWQFIRQIIDDDTGDAVDLTGAEITFDVRKRGECVPILIATVSNGKITLIDTGTFQVWFTLTDMESLCAQTYDVGCTVALNGITTQLLAASLPVVDGIVSA